MNELLKTIAVDLTPILPGGENGGAKIFVLELLKQLSRIAPSIQYVLLTQAASHEELAALDCSNMRRLMILNPTKPVFMKKGMVRKLVSFLLAYMPTRLRHLVIRLGYKFLKKNSSLTNQLDDVGADLLFCPFTAPTYFNPVIPTICTIYDLQYKTFPEFFSTESVAHRDYIFVEACRKATALVAISNYSRDMAVEYSPVDLLNIHTIYLRMAQRVLPQIGHKQEVLGQLGLNAQRYLMYPANFWKHKNHEMLFTAFNMACHASLPADIKLVCTGTHDTRQAWLAKTVLAMGLGDRIIFPGYLPESELVVLMANSIGVIFPSLYEGFGLPIIEAMAAGVPVACSNVTSLPEIAANAAILFDPRSPTKIAETMVSLVQDERLRADVIAAGRLRAAEFLDTERMAMEYLEIFQHSLQNKKINDSITGVYLDGWLGPTLVVRVAPTTNSSQTINFQFLVPEWLPESTLKMQVSKNGQQTDNSIRLTRGLASQWSILVEPEGGNYQVNISPTFVPARFGHGADQRNLTMILKNCMIMRSNDASVQLFPESEVV